MHPKFQQADSLTKPVLDAAFRVHKHFGPGLLESIYQHAISRDCDIEGIPFKKEVKIPIAYRGEVFDEFIRADLFVDDCLLVELKAVEKTKPEHIAQTISYMKLLDAPIGLIINFFEPYLKNGIRRLTLTGADK
ncbi:GxxExxY protein [Rubellicoccus peritrichatus]|uniref:GxxExxY protein n=1 Tax=Rubellicoccus peritrichatus TaxID=3080537 RepID=A0AAQ3LES4_9BACT|nr:GxxExxY protein [Puniceicoccus sp. CR14]WOO42610.1 GxxExxY protein [Puniceicoccus sp. CR14]